ncbi:MAG: A/G-specific adenine glycosylase [Armatimonadetes bacterium]|nr:A/G-specific adenine glycosylase [Armatimonadota bacterium]
MSPVRLPSSEQRRAFVRRLLRWYRRHRRDLPWRRTTDPYRVLVSEIMLQQTQVDRVLPKYREFLRKYPSIEALAAASVDAVRETWYPLGYNIRPVRLHAIAREVVRRFDGRIPDDRDTLLRLKGIGPYTAGAVLSFAYGKRASILDTNVRRVVQRVFYGTTPQRDTTLWQVVEHLLPSRAVYDFNQAVMELGATTCVARTPRCAVCPVRALCRAQPYFAREAARRDAARGVAAGRAAAPGRAGAPRLRR